MRVLPLLALAAFAACAPAKKTAEFDLYLEHFEAVKSEGSDIYLRAAAVAEERGGEKLDQRRQAVEARLQALRIIDKYNKVLVGVARGEDPKHLKSGMRDVGGKLSSYRPSAQTTFAFASAVPYLGTLLSGAGLVQEALAKRQFHKAVRAAQEPISAILDILLLDSAPLETLLVEQARREQDASRAAVDSLASRFYKKLKTLKPSPEVGGVLAAHNALRERAGLSAIPDVSTAAAAAATTSDLEYLAVLTDQAGFNLLTYRRGEDLVSGEQALFSGYRAALKAAQAALAALNKDSEQDKISATGQFNEQAFGMKQQSVKLREASR